MGNIEGTHPCEVQQRNAIPKYFGYVLKIKLGSGFYSKQLHLNLPVLKTYNLKANHKLVQVE